MKPATIVNAKGTVTNFPLDPRTKLVLLLTINIVMIGGGLGGISAVMRPVFASIPFLLLIAEKKRGMALIYFVFIVGALCLEIFLVSRTQGALNLIIVIASGLFSRFVPGLIMGYYVVSTTKISELVAALERLRFSQKIIIPFAVMLRFFPTVGEENNAISDAMRMRNIRFSSSNVLAVLEYRIVPLLMSTVKIGEELSAAALTRGLGNPVRRTNICRIGFQWKDIMLLAIAASAFLLWVIL